MTRQQPEARPPRVEPEIIPPGAPTPRWPGWRVSSGGQGRVYVARVGPLGFTLFVLALAALAAVIVVLVVGAFLFWLLLAGIVAIAAAALGLLRRGVGR